MKTKTVDPLEIEKFSAMAEEWWDPRGKFKPLHDLGPVRVGWILEQVLGAWCMVPGKKTDQAPGTNHQALQGLALLDIGCGGGLISEPMARLGAAVTGIDASEKNIAIAKLHAEQSGLAIDYRCTTAEELWSGGVMESWDEGNEPSPHHPTTPSPQFDIVLALEIVEHVADVGAFVAACAALVKPGGLIIMSTLSRTAKSYALAIVGAEMVLRWLPRGTHDWHRFLKPHELCREMAKHAIEVGAMTGVVLDPLSWKWKLSTRDLDVNYMVCGRKS